MQQDFIKAFRERLRRAGFTDVRIYKEYYSRYIVWCTGPDGKTEYRALMTKEQIEATPKLVWFDEDTKL